MKTRNELGRYFEQFKQTGIGAEIGVQNGWNSRSILSGYSGKLICVDVWESAEELKNAVRNLTHFSDRIIYYPFDSLMASDLVKDESLDFVYIDAGHEYIEVKLDFMAWYPKVRKGGIVSGHDYGINTCQGVKQFVDEMIKQMPEIDVQFTTDDVFDGMDYQSWYFVKP